MTRITEIQRDKEMEHEMEAGLIDGAILQRS